MSTKARHHSVSYKQNNPERIDGRDDLCGGV